MLHFLKREAELAGKVEVIGQIYKKNRIVLFSRGVRGYLFPLTVLFCFIFQFSISWELLAQDLSITLKTSRVPWAPFTDCPCPKIVSVSKPV